MKKQKKVLLIAIICVIALTGIVYATFTALTLKININSCFVLGLSSIEAVCKSLSNIVTSGTDFEPSFNST